MDILIVNTESPTIDIFKAGVKSKIREKLKLDLPGFGFVMIKQIISVEEYTPDASNSALTTNVGAAQPRNDCFDQKVKELLSGEISKQMGNSELLEYFKQVEKKKGGDPTKILGIPKGEPLFIFCLIQGKKNKVRSITS